MSSHVIVGASRGIGYGFLENLSKDPANTVIGVVRSVGPTQQKVDQDGLKNVTIVPGDLTDYKSLVAAAAKVATITGGAVDHVWINGAYMSGKFTNHFLSEFDDDYSSLLSELQTEWSTNVVGVINAINAFLPLVKKSSVKKIITISSGHADNNLITNFGVWQDAPYAITKGAANLVVAKYDARYRSEGILFLSLSPGLVDTGHLTDEIDMTELIGKFMNYNPNMAPPITPAQSVASMLKMVASCDAEHDGGQFYSHLGKHQGWLNTQ